MRIFLGIALLVFSLTPLLLPQNYINAFSITISSFLFLLGIIIVNDSITTRLGGHSLIKLVLKTRKRIFNFFIVCLAGYLLLDVFLSYLGGLWWYPYYSTFDYMFVVIFLGGSSLYFFTIITSYFTTKTILDKLRKGKRIITTSYKYENAAYTALFVIGLGGLMVVMYHVLSGTNFFRDFVFTITTSKKPYITLDTVIIAFFALWFISEYIEYKRKRTSLIKDVIHGYYHPLIAIFIASMILLLYMELQYLPIKAWVYSYEPLDGATFLNLPAWIYVGWPLHYISFISFYRAVGDEPSGELLTGDTIA